jgi:hypothetical protein
MQGNAMKHPAYDVVCFFNLLWFGFVIDIFV